MDNIAGMADDLIALSDEVTQGFQLIQNVTAFDTHIFDSLLNLVGNMHDPVVITVQSHMLYGEELMQDYVKMLSGVRTRIKAKGYAIKRLGEWT
jgi:hypothetical protein